VANAPLIADKLPEPYRTLLTRALSLENLSPLAHAVPGVLQGGWWV